MRLARMLLKTGHHSPTENRFSAVPFHFRVDIRKRLARIAWLLLALVAMQVSASEIALEGRWRLATPQETVADVRTDDPMLHAFDPAQPTLLAASNEIAWVLLRPRDGAWPQQPWVLGIMNSGLQKLTLYVPGEAPRHATLGTRDAGEWPAHGRRAFAIESPIASGQPLLLHVDAHDAIASPLIFSAQPAAQFIARDSAWLALASACLAIMLAMATMALCFALRLRDATFAHYAIFVFGYGFILALQSGYVFEPLGWRALAASPRLWGRLSVAIAIISAALFFMRFADLPRYVRRGRHLLAVYAATVGVVAVLGLVPGLAAVGRTLINPLLIVGAPLFLGIAAVAAWRGSRYAALFMLGWTPLLSVTALGSLQLYGSRHEWAWSDQSSLLCGALEALLFSLALAYRTLESRRAHAQARQQADIDSLTGLYNRRAWQERIDDLGDDAPLSLLFLDLDHFKRLNDDRGHHVGDDVLRTLSQAIRSELRQTDIAGRYGGEEFVLALVATESDQAARIAERIRERLQRDVGAHAPASTVSIGVATRLPGESLTMLLRRADRAMYAAKRAGRNRVELARSKRSYAEA